MSYRGFAPEFSVLPSQQGTGDGVTTQITLIRTPGNTNSVLLSVNGIDQRPNVDYSIIGTVLTTTSAIGSGIPYNIRFLGTAAEIGKTDSDSVSYIPAGTGAVGRKVQSKLRESVSVKDFGAVGNGVTDDTAAFNAAVAAATPKAVFVEAGSYRITGTVTGKFYSFGLVTIIAGTVNMITNLVP